MFCPTCGRDNAKERKFCSSCGTNLEAVSELLSGSTTNFFTRLDMGLDHLIARYSEHVFKDAQSNVADRTVANSWKLLGKGALTSLLDIFLSLIIWNVFTFRFHMLLISTPFRLLSERSARQEKAREELEKDTLPKLPPPTEQKWIAGAVASVSEHTTEKLQDYSAPRPEKPMPRDRDA